MNVTSTPEQGECAVIDNMLIRRIQQLSAADTKTLSQKALKTAEEVGELAKVVMPYESVAGSIHRFVTREQIIEEAVDTILCAASILCELETTSEEASEMMDRKLNKWQGLQSAELGVTHNSIPFEVHITVRVPRYLPKYFIPAFTSVCEEIGVKPIVIGLENGQITGTDIMTSSKHIGTNQSVYEHASMVSAQLMGEGYDVVRIKIETVPWHPAAPKMASSLPIGCYFESHIPVLLPRNRLGELKDLVPMMPYTHLSRNEFKRMDNDNIIMMLTYRRDDVGYDEFNRQLGELIDRIERCGFEHQDVITEYSIFDTNVSHDRFWVEPPPKTEPLPLIPEPSRTPPPTEIVSGRWLS